MSDDAFAVRLGKAQIDAMFRRQDQHAIDDSEFIPLLEVVLNAFETVGAAPTAVEELWQHAYAVYDRACRESEPDSPFEENKELMQRYLLGPRKLIRKPRRGRR